MEEGDEMGYEQRGPLPLLSSWAAAHKHCAGQRMSALYLDQSSRCSSFLGSSQKLKNLLTSFIF